MTLFPWEEDSIYLCFRLEPADSGPRGLISSSGTDPGIDFAVELPRLDTGKLYKRFLRDPYWEGRERKI